MPGMNGLAAIPEVNFRVIFTTSRNEYAVKAFKVNAIDYLLKPVNIAELKYSVEKAQKNNLHKSVGVLLSKSC
jgi:two-component system LytT family response regulator